LKRDEVAGRRARIGARAVARANLDDGVEIVWSSAPEKQDKRHGEFAHAAKVPENRSD
jgi:hypothetical protein